VVKDPDIPSPLISQRADPHLSWHADQGYLFTGTVPEYDRIELRRATDLAGLAGAKPVVIWRRHPTGPMGAHIWAPELHRLDDRWFIYFAAGDAEDVWRIRIYVLECAGADPLRDPWHERGQLDTGWESFALDATTFAHRGQRYLAWAQHDPAFAANTCLYLAPLATPLTLAGPAVKLSAPELPWEGVRFAVNEGPAVLIRHGRVWLSYSAAGTGAEYCLGLLEADADADLLDPHAWRKSPVPVFATDVATGRYGPGHNSFTTTADGRTDLLVYHARPYRDIMGDPLADPNRHTHVRAFGWRADGSPDFGDR
jgi:GH43 family beta-xylosidase